MLKDPNYDIVHVDLCFYRSERLRKEVLHISAEGTASTTRQHHEGDPSVAGQLTEDA